MLGRRGKHQGCFFLTSCASKAASFLVRRLSGCGPRPSTNLTKSSSSIGGHKGGAPGRSDRKKWPSPVRAIEYEVVPVRLFRRSTAALARVERTPAAISDLLRAQ